MLAIYKLINTIKNYDWGQIKGLEKHFNIKSSASDSPYQAELWLGDHPDGPSQTIIQEQDQSQCIGIEQILTNPLPFLFKILTIDKPLSIQTHPNLEQAQKGFTREEQSLPKNDPIRSYRDQNEKKEMILAYTPMDMLVGFRKNTEIKDNLQIFLKYGFPQKIRKALEKNQIDIFFKSLFEIPLTQQKNILQKSLDFCQKFCAKPTNVLKKKYKLYRTILKIHDQHQGDFHCLSPLWLNLISLKPHQAVYLPARQVHSYLSGVGIEIMSNSDNVLRAGLTNKHLDIVELLQIVDFEERQPLIFEAQMIDSVKRSFCPPEFPFTLSFLDLKKEPYNLSQTHVPAILFCSAGKLTLYNNQEEQNPLSLEKGESILLTSLEKNTTSKNQLILKGTAQAYLAYAN